RSSCDSEVDRGLEAAVAVAEQYAHRACVIAGDKIGLAVDIEVPHRYGKRAASDTEVGGRLEILETAVAVTEQHADGVRKSVAIIGVIIGAGEIGFAVAVEVAHRHGTGFVSRAEVSRRLEAAVAVVEQHAERTRITIGGDEI